MAYTDPSTIDIVALAALVTTLRQQIAAIAIIPASGPAGQVLTSGGAGVWSASPTLTSVIVPLVGTTSDTGLDFEVGASIRWQILNSGNTYAFQPVSDNTYDVGRTGTRPRTGYFGTSLVTPLVTLGANLALSSTAPTITSGFNTSPTIGAGSTSFCFSVGTGTTPATNTAVIGLPTAANGWCFSGQDLSDGGFVNQVASTTTSASFKYYSRTTGLAINWPASATIVFVGGAR